jgi:hypothetical protein
MTTQISDSVLLGGTRFQLLASSGAPLFDPRDYGVTTEELSSACWEGYYCTYAVVGQELLLRDFHLGLSEADAEQADRGEGPTLFGRIPRKDVRVIRREKLIDGKLQVRQIVLNEGYVIDDLNTPWPFTGGFVLGHEYDSLRSAGNYGPSQPYEWKVLRELVIERGQVLDVRELDAEAAALRALVIAELPPEDGESAANSLRFSFGSSARRPHVKRDAHGLVADWAKRHFSFRYASFEGTESAEEA